MRRGIDRKTVVKAVSGDLRDVHSRAAVARCPIETGQSATGPISVISGPLERS